MPKLAICVPNYNRIDKLKGLLEEIVGQIKKNQLQEDVQVVISDDCSDEDPTGMVEALASNNRGITIHYKRAEKNCGMDHNFMNCVVMSDAEYAWIVGNDDMVVKDGIKKALDILNENEGLDFLVTPFDTMTDDLTEFVKERLPFGNRYPDGIVFNTSNPNELEHLIYSIEANYALFGFLSNVIFKKKHWDFYRDRGVFNDKFGTIFIQVYMNIQVLLDGAIYVYNPTKLVINRSGDEIATSDKREYDVAVGLYDVIDFFFKGRKRDYLMKAVVDEYINGRTWCYPGKRQIRDFNTKKVDLYRKIFIEDVDVDTLSGMEIYIYGAGKYGRRTQAILKRHGIDACGFIDQNWKQLEYSENDVEIISLEELDNRKTDTIFVLIANAKNTTDIYELLESRGIKKIGALV